MCQLRNSQQDQQQSDSLSSEEDDQDEDRFELLTAENLFSTLLSRVKCLTQQLNDSDMRADDFSNSHSMKKLRTPQRLWEENRLFIRYELQLS